MQYLKEHKQFIYLNLLTSGGLDEYLASVDEQADGGGAALLWYMGVPQKPEQK